MKIKTCTKEYNRLSYFLVGTEKTAVAKPSRNVEEEEGHPARQQRVRPPINRCRTDAVTVVLAYIHVPLDFDVPRTAIWMGRSVIKARRVTDFNTSSRRRGHAAVFPHHAPAPLETHRDLPPPPPLFIFVDFGRPSDYPRWTGSAYF